MGAVFAPTRFSLVSISVRDLVADGKFLVRNSGVGGGGENLILIGGGGIRSSQMGGALLYKLEVCCSLDKLYGLDVPTYCCADSGSDTQDIKHQ